MSTPAANLLEFILEKIENLPEDLHDSFLMICEQDSRFESIRFFQFLDSRRSLFKKRTALLKTIDKSDEEVLAIKKKIEKECKRAVSYIDEKVVYTEKLSNLINSHLQLLEESLQAINVDDRTISDGIYYDGLDKEYYGDEIVYPEESTLESAHKARRIHYSAYPNQEQRNYESPSSFYTEIESTAKNCGIKNSQVIPKSNNIEPTNEEPVYCICQQVSYGDMIACDNSSCSIEWFHYQCVGLNAPPKGKWYCPDCSSKGY